MPSGCRSGALVLLLSNQLDILETPAPTQKPIPAVSYTLEHWKAHTLQNKVPSQAASPLLDWRDSRPSRTRRAQHRYLQVKTWSHTEVQGKACLVSNQPFLVLLISFAWKLLLPHFFLTPSQPSLSLEYVNRGAPILSQTAFTLQHKLRWKTNCL